MKKFMGILLSIIVLLYGITPAFADQVLGDAVQASGSNHDQEITLNVLKGETWSTNLDVYVRETTGNKHVVFPVEGKVSSTGDLVIEQSWKVFNYSTPDTVTASRKENTVGQFTYVVNFESTTGAEGFSGGNNRDFVKINVNVTEPTTDTTAPSITPPGNIITEATGITTSVELGSASTDDATATISNDAPKDGFLLGTTIVTWTATDASGNKGTATQTVTITDTTAPEFTSVPANITKEASAINTPVEIGNASASDIFGVKVENDAPSEGFSLGTTTVTWTATDLNGNTSTATQDVTITDKTKPVFTSVPGAITKEATAINTPVVIGDATAYDIFGTEVTNNAPSEGFSLGTTTVIWTANDPNGNSETAEQKVTITDTTAPTFTTEPVDITKVLTGTKTQVDLGDVTASDIFGAKVANDAPVDGFPIGTTIVTWTATDANGNTSTVTQNVTVKYAFGGILQPINQDDSSVFKQGSTIPVKFWLKNANNAFVSTAEAKITYTKLNNNPTGNEIEAVSTSAATTGNLFRYDSSSNQYIFNLSTKGLSVGDYRLTITLNDGTSYSVKISLK